MKSTACSLLIAAAAAILLNAAVPPSAIAHDREQGNGRGARNVIFMVPDGMGLADVTAARIFKNGIDGAPLHFETLDHIGYQRTYSANSTITDSAPAASAWACGEKFNNGEICFHGNGLHSLGLHTLLHAALFLLLTSCFFPIHYPPTPATSARRSLPAEQSAPSP